tara:strand:+ start:578 stop:754 length:177 start_codon:yes stop_codon:yes gene_type:complete
MTMGRPKDNNRFSSQYLRDFNVWYKKNKDTDEVKEFLVHLREVTGIYSPEDLLNKYKR